TYSPQQNQWIAVTKKEVLKIDLFSQDALEANKLVAEAKDMFKAGFIKQGTDKMKKALDKDPLMETVSISGELQSFILFHKTPLAIIAELLLYSSNKLLQSSKISKTGIILEEEPAPDKGVIVKGTFPNSASDKAGIVKGDIILTVNNKPINSQKGLSSIIDPLPIGNKVSLTIKRNTSQKKVVFNTETGFKSTRAAFTVFHIFEYGFYATKAGHPDITEQAAARIRSIAAKYPSGLKNDYLEELAIGLDALAMAAKGNTEKAYEYILSKGRISNPMLLMYITDQSDSFAPLYKDRNKFAFLINKDATDLPDVSDKMSEPQPYPDLNGRLIDPKARAEGKKAEKFLNDITLIWDKWCDLQSKSSAAYNEHKVEWDTYDADEAKVKAGLMGQDDFNNKWMVSGRKQKFIDSLKPYFDLQKKAFDEFGSNKGFVEYMEKLDKTKTDLEKAIKANDYKTAEKIINNSKLKTGN
ncbi:MAG: PDZ domain-containing protein, partial [Candidatus Margulisiibacteriota bacterium]